ncbi:uncharacterized protein LOC110246016 [Exaiptasia diaphana]|uniref:Uncharacterized protein n=1 Tax=Exaiptasia diaphana TaxID=2652724 RepID=A0A913YPG9_EXADI|nr:uncharacterized protein LOC110246016 [Exaiptasia diaphana]KXJ10042.1 hypothetical protein AC249_AIPGENE16694 [Exaiptasia diaphana]
MKAIIFGLLLGVLQTASSSRSFHDDVFKECFRKYTISFSLPPTLKNHCSTIKNTSDCLGYYATVDGPLLDLMRFYILEHAFFDIRTHLCQPYDLSNIQMVLDGSDVFKKYGKYSIEYVPQEGAALLMCARQVHLSAKDYYKTIVTLQQLLCDDPVNLVKFYKAKAREIKCKSKVLEAFISTIKHIVPMLNDEIRKKLHISCP